MGSLRGIASMTGVASITGLGSTISGLLYNFNAFRSINNICNPSLQNVPAGARMVLTCASSDAITLAVTVSITNSNVSWTKRVANPGGSNSGTIEIWDGTYTAGGTEAPTVTWTGGTVTASSCVLYWFTGQEASPGGTSNSQQLGAAPSVAVTTARANSILVCVTSDWNAINTAPTYRDSALQIFLHNHNPANYIAYHYLKQCTTATTYTEGISSPSTMQAGTGVYEIRTP